MKKIIIGIVAATVIGVLVVIWLQPKAEQESPVQSDDTTESTAGFSPEVIYEDKTTLPLELQNKVDALVQSSVQITPDFYRIAEYPKGASLSSEVDYSIDYSKQSNTFIVALYKYPLLDTRMRASMAFLEELQVSQEEACRMNVKVTVNSSVNVELAGDNLGFSFCPERVDLSNVIDDRVSNEEQ